MMRIVIDLQGAQSSGSRNRGIGRYTLSLALAIVRNRRDHEIFIALNGLFPDTIEPLRAAFDGLLPQENICVWESPKPVCHISRENDSRRRCAELVFEAFLASFKPDIVLVSSLFEGLVDDAVTSIGALNSTVPTTVILYDLIPLIQRDPYLENPAVEAWYENKLDHLRRADLLLAISESSRQEGIRYIGFSAEACVNISTAADPKFQPQQIDCGREQEIRQRYGLHRPFVMYTGGIDHRKNIEGLIRAYARLPASLRASHQLAIICSIQPQSSEALRMLAKEQGMKTEELVLTGFVPEEDLLTLYNLCKAFVFPSWHEGFGLPALEAMSCGRAVIGANTSSLPEVIGRQDALFDPMIDTSIAEKLTQVLTDDAFRLELEQHGLARAKLFSWDTSALRAVAAIEAWHVKKVSQSLTCVLPAACRPKLAYVSPLPPERSGISDYSAELLPELSRHYDIDVIVAQDCVSDPWVKANSQTRSVGWFRAHAASYDRVLYHFGNSHFHQHMISLLGDVPGVVVLHDFFLSGLVSLTDITEYQPSSWEQALYQSHGYTAVKQWFRDSETSEVLWRYPCNLGVLQGALGVVVHSENSRRLAGQWIGEGAADEWAIVPLLRAPELGIEKSKARSLVKIKNDDFVVCSFGMLGPHKLNQRLLRAWLASDLAKNANCILVFVGENHSGNYGAELASMILRSGLGERIRITGWADGSTFRHYLAAADIGVQLRTLSRGETSAAVLDCMNYGIPTIVNANGSMADLPAEAVWMLPDEFSEKQLVEALTTLWMDSNLRQSLGQRGREVIQTHHQPRRCAEQYAKAIELFYRRAQVRLPKLINTLANVEPPLMVEDLPRIATALTNNFPPQPRRKQLLLDISVLVQHDAKSGIQRVVRALLREFLRNPPHGWAVEPVYANHDTVGYRYARRFTSRFLSVYDGWAEDDPIETWPSDIFLGLDLNPNVASSQIDYLLGCHLRGLKIYFVVYDLLPILLPQYAPQGVESGHQRWLETISQFDGVACISRTVSQELAEWQSSHKTKRMRAFKNEWFHLGADIDASCPSEGLPENFQSTLKLLSARPLFLMVGTLEPRKGHRQALAAFDLLWQQEVDVNLVIVGKQGWLVEELVKRLRNHPELNKRLFWLEVASDECLNKIYSISTCLIAASEGEGFGLPLIEAAQNKIPVIARGIPVFREVAGEHAFYFSGLEPKDLADTIKSWLALHASGNIPNSENIPFLNWEKSAQKLFSILTDNLK